MNLVTLRQKFVELSGRYDLVSSTSTWADYGADFFIGEAQDFLDRRANVHKKRSRLFYELAAGDWYQNFQKCRIIEAVYVNNDEGRSRLTKKDFHWLHEEYAETIAEADTGTPLYFCPALLRTNENADIDNLGAFFNYVMSAETDELYRGVLILPPPDEAIVVEIIGQFYSTELSNDSDESFWTIKHPGLLILASLYQLEILGHRNSEGAKNYLDQIDLQLDDIDKDIAEEESHDVDQMEG